MRFGVAINAAMSDGTVMDKAVRQAAIASAAVTGSTLKPVDGSPAIPALTIASTDGVNLTEGEIDHIEISRATASLVDYAKSSKANGNGEKDSSGHPFFGAGQWGAGLALLNPSGGILNETAIQNGVVRVTDSQAWTAKLVLERHYYATKGENQGCATEGWLGACLGLFVGVGLGDQQIIDMVGGGIMVGAGRVPGATDSTARQHNFGIGVGRMFRVKSLGDGISADAPLPPGETDVRHKFRDTNVLFLLYSYSLPQ
jgi:hypothetical protein